jgi:hypothetical protein
MRATLDRLITRVYWRIQNKVEDTFVASSRVSRKIAVGGLLLVRRYKD